MLNEYQPIEALVDRIKGTTGVLSNFLSRISGWVALIVLLGVIVSQTILK